MEKQHALQIWENLFGENEVAYDFASHPMKKEDFQNENSHYGWDIDEKKPFLNREDNFLPCSLNTIRFRNGKPSFKVGNNLFEVRKGKRYGTFDIYDITDRNHPINMDPTEENQDPSFNRERFHSIAVSQRKTENFIVPNTKSISNNVFCASLASDNKETEGKVEEETKKVEPVLESQPLNKPEIISLDDETEEEERKVENTAENKTSFDTEEALQNLSSFTRSQIDEPKKEEDDALLLSSIEELKRQIDENLNEIDALNQQISSLNSEKETLEQKNLLLVEEKETAVKEREEALSHLQSQQSETKEQIDSILKANEALKQKVEELLLESSKNKEKIDEITQQKDALSNELQTAKDANATLSSSLNEIQNQTSFSAEEIESEKKKNNELSIAVSEKEKEISLLNENLKRSEEEKQNLISELEKNKEMLQQKEAFSTKLMVEADNRIAQESKNSEVQINCLKRQYQDLESLNKKKDEDFNLLKTEAEGLKNQIEELKNQLQGKEEEERNLIAQYQAEKERQTLESENLKKEFFDRQESLSLSEKEKQSALIQIEKLKEEILSLQKSDEENKKKSVEESQALLESKAAFDGLHLQYEELQNRYASLNSEQERIVHQSSMQAQSLEECSKKIDLLTSENEELKKNQIDDSLRQEMSKLKSNIDVLTNENNHVVGLNQVLMDKNATLQHEVESATNKIAEFKAEYEGQLKQREDSIEEIQKENDKNVRLIAYLKEGGKIEFFPEFEQYLNENNLPFSIDEIQKALLQNRNWKNKSFDKLEPINGESKMVLTFDATLIDEQTKKKEKAYNFYDQIFGLDKYKVSDFAGRYLSLDKYNDKESVDGWDYDLIDKNKEESLENIYIANYRTIKDFRSDTPFDTNGHRFQVVKEGDKEKIVSADYIADPYDFTQALRVTQNNQERVSPLLYLFVKVVGLNTSEPDKTALMEFFDLMDRTVKRCCPLSFIEMKTVIGSGKGNYAFITFDGSIEESYHENLDYALLLNSYRREYRIQEKLNAVIVLNEVDVSFSKRHLDYDTLLSETRDDELRALRYEFNMAVINSIIKRTLHVGPRILDKLPLNQSLLKPSQIGQGNFAKMYRFNKEFKVYNFVYSLTHKEEKE